MKSALSHSVFVVICDTFTPLSSLFIPPPSAQVLWKKEQISEFTGRQLRVLKVMNLSISGPIVGSNWDSIHLYSEMPRRLILTKHLFFPLFRNIFFIDTASFYFPQVLFFWGGGVLFATFLNNSPLNSSQCVFCRNVKK